MISEARQKHEAEISTLYRQTVLATQSTTAARRHHELSDLLANTMMNLTHAQQWAEDHRQYLANGRKDWYLANADQVSRRHLRRFVQCRRRLLTLGQTLVADGYTLELDWPSRTIYAYK
ncbi:MAG: hypothetical protein KDE59_12785 [Anaerolineales bacterium]|nr:hypothetical protein [Anaerolineales bacterium]